MQGDAFTSFYKDYYRLILTVAQQRLRGSTEAEDVTAEVFRIVWQHCCEGHEPSLPWTYRALRNVIGNEYRRSSRADQFRQEATEILAREFEDVADDDAIEVRRAVDKLGDEDRELIRMAYWEDLSAPEIASVLSCTAVTVRVRLFRARQRLKVHLESIEFERWEVADG